MTGRDAGASPPFPPSAALHVVKIACERPDTKGRSLSQWDCGAIARELVRDGVVASISPETVRQILWNHRLKPWRHQMWLSAKVPRDAAFAEVVRRLSDLYTHRLRKDEVVLCVDEHTNLQPRPRLAPTLPTQPDRPTRIEHEYHRDGALNLFAAFDTRTGKVYGRAAGRKRQAEFIEFLEYLECEIPRSVRRVHLVLDNYSTHTGKLVRKWLSKHPRLRFFHPPVHCSWMNQVEQWFGILKRKRLRIIDFASKDHLAERLMAFVSEWNERAHPFEWTERSFTKILAKCEAAGQVTAA
jgi:transposase